MDIDLEQRFSTKFGFLLQGIWQCLETVWLSQLERVTGLQWAETKMLIILQGTG
jgi:hypothetical protein